MNAPWKKWTDPNGLNLHFDTPTAIMQVICANQSKNGDSHYGCTMEEVLDGLGYTEANNDLKCMARLLLDFSSRPSCGILHCVNDAIEGVGQSTTRYCLGYEKIIDRQVSRFRDLSDEKKLELCQGAKFDMTTPEPPNANWAPDIV